MVRSALSPRSHHGLHRSSIHTDKHDIMPVRTRVASDAKQLGESAGEGGDGSEEWPDCGASRASVAPTQGKEI